MIKQQLLKTQSTTKQYADKHQNERSFKTHEYHTPQTSGIQARVCTARGKILTIILLLWSFPDNIEDWGCGVQALTAPFAPNPPRVSRLITQEMYQG